MQKFLRWNYVRGLLLVCYKGNWARIFHEKTDNKSFCIFLLLQQLPLYYFYSLNVFLTGRDEMFLTFLNPKSVKNYHFQLAGKLVLLAKTSLLLNIFRSKFNETLVLHIRTFSLIFILHKPLFLGESIHSVNTYTTSIH